jgi:hypothetical protein
MNQPAGDGAGVAGLPPETPIPEDAAPPAIEDDEDVIDAEIVESPVLTPAAYGNPEAYGALPAPDYSDAGVPSLDYVREKIEGRFGTAIGSAELAKAAADREAIAKAAAQQQVYVTADQQREARAQAAKDKLDEIRRSLHP